MNVLRSSRYGVMVIEEKDMFIGKSLDFYGEFSEGEPELWREFIQSGDTVLDIGANMGSLTLPLAQMVGSDGVVHAFEPERIVFVMLCGNVAINNLRQVRCHQKAVGDSFGTIAISELDYDKTKSFGNLELDRDYGGNQRYKVDLITIDSLKLDSCRFMKIDVEGFESKVLLGASATIGRLRPILYVENDRPDRALELKKTIADLGYRMFMHPTPLFNPNNFRGKSENIFERLISMNLLCIPNDDGLPFNSGKHNLTETFANSKIVTDDMAL